MSTCRRKSQPADIQKAPLVSVVLPTFDRAKFLKQAIDSVLAQTYPIVELIVVNDGSRDETASLLASYGNRLKTVDQSNQGVSAARNAGIHQASGDLIALLDSDDYWLADKLEQQVNFFLNNPDALICQTEEIWIRNGRRVNPKKRHRKPSGDIFEPSLALCLVSPSAVIFKKSLLAQVGLFDETLPACEDYDLWLRVACKFPVHLIPAPLTVKRGGHDDQLSRMPELDKYRIRALEKVMRSGDLSAAQYAAAHAMLAQKCAIYAQGCRKRGRPAESDDYLQLVQELALHRQTEEKFHAAGTT